MKQLTLFKQWCRKIILVRGHWFIHAGHTLRMLCVLLLGESGGMPPPGKFRKLGAVRLNLGAFEDKVLVHLFFTNIKYTNN